MMGKNISDTLKEIKCMEKDSIGSKMAMYLQEFSNKTTETDKEYIRKWREESSLAFI